MLLYSVYQIQDGTPDGSERHRRAASRADPGLKSAVECSRFDSLLYREPTVLNYSVVIGADRRHCPIGGCYVEHWNALCAALSPAQSFIRFISQLYENDRGRLCENESAIRAAAPPPVCGRASDPSPPKPPGGIYSSGHVLDSYFSDNGFWFHE